ncbi:MAG: hypothetical protein AAFR57_06215, partial [Pseudomonadota bacterium]
LVGIEPIFREVQIGHEPVAEAAGVRNHRSGVMALETSQRSADNRDPVHRNVTLGRIAPNLDA